MTGGNPGFLRWCSFFPQLKETSEISENSIYMMDIKAKMALLKKEVATVNKRHDPPSGPGKGLEYYRNPENFGNHEKPQTVGLSEAVEEPETDGIINVTVQMEVVDEPESNGELTADDRRESGASSKAAEKQDLIRKLKALGIGQFGMSGGLSGSRESEKKRDADKNIAPPEKSEVKKTSKKKKKKEPELPDFIVEETSYGNVYFREVEFSLAHRHGDIFLRELLDVPPDMLAFMGQDDELAGMDLRRTVFLDTETTGLAGGTGTYAFLIGMGYVRENNFTVRLYFMPDYKYEPAMLQHINEFLKDFTGMVTFNGKCYDFPLMKTRFLLNRLKLSNPEPLHLDLLHGSRRLWKKTHGSCKLTSLECSVLDFYREDDIPGQFIPEMYFQYLKNHRFKPMEKVLEHNVFDIVSMAALIVRMWSHLEMAHGGQVCGTDYFSMASIHEKRGEEEKALEFYEKALSEKLNPLAKMKVQQKISRIYKRRKIFDRAVDLWMEMAEEALLDIYAHMELAKHHEHITGDIEKALFYVEQAQEVVERKKRSGSMTVYYTEMRQLNHRKSRLLKKSGKE